MDDEEITPLPKFFLLKTPKHITKNAMVSRSLMKWWALSELNSFVQCHPGWQGLAEPPLTASYIHTGPTVNTKSITRKGRLRALLSPWIVNSTRIASTHACTVPSSRDLAPDRREAGLGPSPHCLASGWEEPRSPAPLVLPITPPSSHQAGNSGWAPHKDSGAYLPLISTGFRYLDAFGGSGPKSESPAGRLLMLCSLQRQCWRNCYTMKENQDVKQKEKAKEIKVRIKFFNTKKVCLSSSLLFFKIYL